MADSIFDNNNIQQTSESNIFDIPSNEKNEEVKNNDFVEVSGDNVYSDEEMNDPNAILQHLLNTNQVSQDQVNRVMQLRNDPQMQQLMNNR